MNGMTKLRVCLAGLGFGVALLIAPAAHAQAESNPDHFTETGVEVGPGGNVAPSNSHAVVAHSAQKQQKAVHTSAHVKPAAARLTVATVVADKNRRMAATEPKR